MTGEHTDRAAERPSRVSSQIRARGLTDEPREPGGQRARRRPRRSMAGRTEKRMRVEVADNA